jgi:hypothetical protein
VQLLRPGTGHISSVRVATSRLYPDQLVYAPARDFVGGHEFAGDQQPARSALSSGLPGKLPWGTGRSSRRPSGLVVKPRALFLAGGLCCYAEELGQIARLGRVGGVAARAGLSSGGDRLVRPGPGLLVVRWVFGRR